MADKKGTGLLMVWVDVPADKEEEFNHWYNEERLQELLAVPGVLNAARYEAVRSRPASGLLRAGKYGGGGDWGLHQPQAYGMGPADRPPRNRDQRDQQLLPDDLPQRVKSVHSLR